MKNKDNEILYLLLSTVYYNSDVTPLVEMGVNYSEIGLRYSQLIRNGLVETVQGKMILTDRGKATMNRLQEDIYKKNVKYLWIMPKIEYQIPKIDENDVYLPNHFE